MFDFQFLKRSVDGVVQHRQKLLKRIEELRREREDIVTAPVARDDVKAMITKWAEESSQKHVENVQRALQPFVVRAKLIEEGRHSQFSVLQAPGVANPGPKYYDLALCLLLGNQLTVALHSVVDQMEWPTHARPIKGRAERIHAIEKELAELGKQESEIVATARGAGIVFD